MALKGDCISLDVRTKYKLNAVAERGAFVSIATVGSGVGHEKFVATVAANPSGVAALGVVMQDVVSIDTTRAFVNKYKHEVLINQNVEIIRKGKVVTNFVNGNPTAGQPAYLAASGYVSPSQATGAPLIGRFETTKDAQGFATVEVNI